MPQNRPRPGVGTAQNPFTIDQDDSEDPNDTQPVVRVINLVSPESSPPPNAKKRRLNDGSASPSTSQNVSAPAASRDVQIRAEGSFSASTPRRFRRRVSGSEKSPPTQIKISPHSGSAITPRPSRAMQAQVLRDASITSPNITLRTRTPTPQITSKVPTPIPRATSEARPPSLHVNSEHDVVGNVFTGAKIEALSPSTPVRISGRKPANSQQSSDDSVSLGTDSPICLRRQQKQAAMLGSPEAQELTLSGMTEKLQELQNRVKNDHAVTVSCAINECIMAHESRLQPFVESVSPFASMKGIQLKGQNLIPDGMPHVRVTNVAIKGKQITKTITTATKLIAKHITDDLPRVPKYSSYTNVKRNILTPDDDKLKFLPYATDIHNNKKELARFNKMVKELESIHKSERQDISSLDNEEAAILRAYLTAWIEELDIGCSERSIMHFLLDDDRDGKLCLPPEDKDLLLDSFQDRLTVQSRRNATMLRDAFSAVFGWDLRDILLPTEILLKMVKDLKFKDDKSGSRFDTYASFTCVICGAIHCPTHGEHKYDSENEGEEVREINDVHVALTYNERLRLYDARKKALQSSLEDVVQDDSPCSEDCYRCCGSDAAFEWPESVTMEFVDAMSDMLHVFTDENTRSCVIGFSWNLPCWQVYQKINSARLRLGSDDDSDTEEKTTWRLEWYDNKRKALKHDWDSKGVHLQTSRGQTAPCAHSGPCKASCPCAQANTVCERFCGCSDDCPRRYTGCPCVSRGVACVLETCICVQMNRECGAECGTCGALERLNPEHKYNDDLFLTGCQNVCLQRGVSKKLLLGESQIEGTGFGLYTAEPIRKGGYISEYSGEVISFAEADRRGIVYDVQLLSFLFDLNKEYAVDADRLGNKTRFINHAVEQANGLNCAAKVLLVNGEHRIKFIALRDIMVGEELLFNYGKSFALKHGLTKTMPSNRVANGKRDLIDESGLGSEAADKSKTKVKQKRRRETALKTVDERKAVPKPTVNKMRKTAAQLDVPDVVEEEQASVYSTPSSDDEEDDEIVREFRAAHTRGKRNTRKPIRYTR